jgi:hypothetical protein
LTVLAAAVGLTATSMTVAQADEGHGAPPEHGHLLVTGIEFGDTGEPVSFEKCRLLANGRALPLNAHHAHVHTGRAGEALWGAGNAAVPLAPLAPWSTCAEFEAMIFED